MCEPNIVQTWQTDDYKVLVEDRDGYAYLHCYVYEFKKSVIKELKLLIGEILEWAYSEGYDGVHSLTKNKKMAEIIPGYMLLSDIEHEGDTYGVYKWA